MQEFKRDRNTLEIQLKDLTKRTTYHDDHLRVIDAWFSQVSMQAQYMLVHVLQADGINSVAA